jgi:hypothetical protein
MVLAILVLSALISADGARCGGSFSSLSCPEKVFDQRGVADNIFHHLPSRLARRKPAASPAK